MNGDKHTLKVHGKDYEITIRWEPEQECYEDVYGEPPPAGYDYFYVILECDDRRDLDLPCMGFVDIPIGPRSAEIARIDEVEEELLAKAYEIIARADRPGSP